MEMQLCELKLKIKMKMKNSSKLNSSMKWDELITEIKGEHGKCLFVFVS
jgi:hypothetical protein